MCAMLACTDLQRVRAVTSLFCDVTIKLYHIAGYFIGAYIRGEAYIINVPRQYQGC